VGNQAGGDGLKWLIWHQISELFRAVAVVTKVIRAVTRKDANCFQFWQLSNENLLPAIGAYGTV
jgi:hypothetical protein